MFRMPPRPLLLISLPTALSWCIALSCFVALFGPNCFAEIESERAHVDQVLRELNSTHGIGAVAISPDGSQLAYVHRVNEKWELVIAPFKSPAKIVRVTAAKKEDAKCSEGSPTWAPDSKHLAFLSTCQSEGQDNIFVASISGDIAAGKPKVQIERLSEAKGEVSDITYSPDGLQIAFLYVQGATRSAGALAAMKPWSGVIGEDGIEIQRVATVEASGTRATGPTFVTPAQLHVYEFNWSPDSNSLAYVAAEPPGENNWWVAKLYTQALKPEPTSTPRAIFAPAQSSGRMHGLQIAVPRWSPDGKSIAFIGGLMSDQGSTGGDIWTIPSTGGDPIDLTAEWRSTPQWFTWAGNAQLYVSQKAGGLSQLVRLDFATTGKPAVSEPIYSFSGTPGDGRLEMSLSSTGDHGTFVFRASSFDHPNELYAVRSDAKSQGFEELQQLTHLNDGAQRIWGKTDSLTWKNEGLDVQGWLHYPAVYEPAKKYALIVLVHGGPAAAAESQWGGRGLSGTALSALGYFVLEPNPRGSYGQGETFAAANRKDFGYGDLRDILAGVDTVLQKYPVDPARIGLTGWSYGGFMTMFAVTQTQRFKAAVAGAGISDWKSYYGENSIDQWMTPYFGASVYQDPGIYAKSSAVDFIRQAKTPTLVVVGDRDGECPAPQSFEFWHALRDQHVPTQLVIYPNEGHGFTNPDHRTDVLVRLADWFQKYMPAGE